MKSLAILLAWAAAASAVVPADMSFDSIDLSKYNDKKKLANFVKCMADDTLIKECSDMEINIRERAKDIVATNCAECGEGEKQAVVFLTSHVTFTDENANDLTKLLKVFDPNGKNSKKYLKALNGFDTKLKIRKIPDCIINKYSSSFSD